jgi:tetratricopeptide (TPR) repeat protein
MDVLFKVADSLKKLGLYQEAAKTFQDLKNTQAYGDAESLDLAIAESEMKIGKIREAQARLVTLLGQKRNGPAVVKRAQRILADSYYMEKNFDGAMMYYAATMPVDRNEEGAALTLYRYADALKRRGQRALALRYYQEALNTSAGTAGGLSDALKGELFMSLGECYFAAEQYEQGISLLTQALPVLPKGSDQRWALFRLTGGYIKTSNPELAEKSSGRVKENTDDPFWAKMADYGLNDGIWFATYEDYLK